VTPDTCHAEDFIIRIDLSLDAGRRATSLMNRRSNSTPVITTGSRPPKLYRPLGGRICLSDAVL
jgi:hypothetical protein